MRCNKGRGDSTAAFLWPPKHPDKTFIGRIERGFDFLSYHFSPAGLTVAAKTVTNFIEKASRLREQKSARLQPARHSRCTSGGGAVDDEQTH